MLNKEDEVTDSNPSEYMCTVVSLIPMELNEEKPHMLPSVFNIPAAKQDDISILHVKEGIHYIANPLIDEGKPGSSFKQITIPAEMARSICEDYKIANIGLGLNAEPGLFWVPGKYTAAQIKKEFPKRIATAREKQNNWFRNLVAQADADWQKNHNMLAVSDLQRHAARQLGIQKDWVELRVQETKPCPYCTVPVPPNAIKCPNCHEVVDKEAYASLKGSIEGSGIGNVISETKIANPFS